MQLEICVDSVESAMAAERGGANRVELCSDLLEGGITPSAGLIAAVRQSVSLAVYVMIRPRGGDFCYTGLEFAIMQDDIRRARDLGAHGVVLGLLDANAHVDVSRTAALVRLAEPLPVTFHRAIDMTTDPLAALDDVLRTGASRVLTSGGAGKVTEALPTVAAMVRAVNGHVSVMPGSGITAKTIADVAARTGATEFHASLRSVSPSPTRFRKDGLSMGSIHDREYKRFVVQEASVRSLRASLDRMDRMPMHRQAPVAAAQEK